MKMTLYEIAPAFAAIAEQDELSIDDMNALDELNLALTEKATNIVALTDNLDTFVKLCESEEKRIKARKAAAKNKLSWLNDYLKYGMETAGVTKIDVGTKKVSLQNNPPKLVVDDETAIPSKYFVIIPEAHQLDKTEVKRALKEGEVAGVHLERTQSLRKR